MLGHSMRSGLAFVLRPASSMDGGAASGASAGGSALSEALHTLSRLLQVVLSDGANRGCLDGVGTETGGDGGLEDSSTALKHLQLLASRRSSTCEQEAAPPPQSGDSSFPIDGSTRGPAVLSILVGVVVCKILCLASRAHSVARNSDRPALCKNL